jgi:hypothetical protein
MSSYKSKCPNYTNINIIKKGNIQKKNIPNKIIDLSNNLNNSFNKNNNKNQNKKKQNINKYIDKKSKNQSRNKIDNKEKYNTFESNLNSVGKNEEMIKEIKNTLDDNLKVMFNFSYENFLSKESEHDDSKDISNEIEINESNEI